MSASSHISALRCRNRTLALGPHATPHLVGILNVTDDSFFADSRRPSVEAALAHARRLVDEGATVIDVGGQSTRPGYTEISNDEEIARTAPVIAELARHLDVALSIDTYQPAVAAAAFEAGAHLLNDIHGLQGPGGPALAALAAKHDAAVIVMHNDSAFRALPPHSDLVAHQKTFFARTFAVAAAANLPVARLVLDPGIGFGKTQPQNLRLIASLNALCALGHPVLLGASRKSFIAHAVENLPPDERLEATLATTALAVWHGVDFLRVHDVRANRRAALLAHALRQNLDA